MTIDIPDRPTTPAAERPVEFLFRMDGHDYTLIAKASVTESLAHRTNVSEVGAEYATVMAARWMISDNGFRKFMDRALAEPSDVMDHNLDAILAAVSYKIAGVVPPKSDAGAVTGRDPRLAGADTGVGGPDRLVSSPGTADGSDQRPVAVPPALAGPNA
ncbi:MAG: hypothetical protein JWQ81_1674 [Amycolatopsis sp.]|jgi:hypothetical protein|uniref:hypothetical protein n=1 Tax=Amycolatopsis sp. TaxID=37632 RepID=UPI002632F8B0|nr:hypothetical protein [Amycolatopsis sp.]MCU1680935.1 hypothetical protein [Amycolatopsis sp.]